MSCLHRDKDPHICKKTLEDLGKHPLEDGAHLSGVLGARPRHQGARRTPQPIRAKFVDHALTAFEDQSTPYMKVDLIRELWCI
jgi:hypothetical protein